MIETFVTFIHSRVTDPHALFLRLLGIRIGSYDYLTEVVDVLCMAFWRHGSFMLVELRATRGFKVSSVKLAFLVCLSR